MTALVVVKASALTAVDIALLWLCAGLGTVALIALVPSQKLRRVLWASSLAGGIAIVVIIRNCCPDWCWLEPFCWFR